MAQKPYKITIGLEVHAHLLTKSKAFCSCANKFGEEPNSLTCPVCLGMPGSLPVLNEDAFQKAIKVALALGCKISPIVKFDRKNYFYPDLPKNYQISQYDMPVGGHGKLDDVKVLRVHMEEDAGKLVHADDRKGDYSLVDFNRTGVPLLEIVTEPDIHSADQAYQYLTNLKAILQYLEVSDCNMQEGSLRCDANISLAPEDAKELGTKTEVKNMNSFRGVKLALEYEAERIHKLLESGERVVQETRLWDETKNKTFSMRSKEEAHDYRYFPEPDLVPFTVDEKLIKQIANSIPELPQERTSRFEKEYKLSDYDSKILTSDKLLADYFENCAKLIDNFKLLANWLIGPVMAIANEKNITITGLGLKEKILVSLLKMIDTNKINQQTAKAILPEVIKTGLDPEKIVAQKGLGQISDQGELEKITEDVIKNNPKPVKDYKNGKTSALQFLLGQVMRLTKGKADAKLVREIVEKKLK